MCASLLGLAGQPAVSTSCSLLHVPLDLQAETSLAPEVAGRLAFARQKVGAGREAYPDWAVRAFRLATSGVADATQIHTHMCYSEFGEILGPIAALDADVTTVEAARSRMEFIADLTAAGFAHGIGPGVWDIHSPRVPAVDEIAESLSPAMRVIGPARLWVNPDCGLKTRGYAETEPALRNLVEAARQVRVGATG